jgi:dimethylargininase
MQASKVREPVSRILNSQPNTYRHALVRPPGDAFERAISSRGLPLDAALARKQHTGYCAALRDAGISVEALPADETNPDSCFMQDPALIVAGRGILCRMGAASRSREPGAMLPWLEGRFPISRIEPPGTLEGGDVIVLPGRLIVGQSARTNEAGIKQLRAILESCGVTVETIPVTRYLHLMTAASYVGRKVMLVLDGSGYESHPAFQGFDIVTVPAAEAGAADAGGPRTAAALRKRGFTVHEPDLSAFAAADGGVTCLSLVW